MPSLATNDSVVSPPAGARVAIIMDGNGRWAAQHGVSVTEGHRAGADALQRTTEAALDLGVSELTVYGFSTENFARDPEEIAGIMRLFVEQVQREAPIMRAKNARMCFTGRRSLLGPEICEQMTWAEELTAGGTAMTLCIAFGYGGRAEIVDAVHAAQAAGEPVTEASIRAHLYRPELADPDLIVRTAGEQRMSNFLLWQGAYAELHFSGTLWPDFGRADLEEALHALAARERRFGRRTVPAVEVVSS